MPLSTSRAAEIHPSRCASPLQWCVCRMVMRSIAPRTHFACRHRHACIACMGASSATMSCQPLTPPGVSGHAHTHALHVPIIACKCYISQGLESAGCRSGPRSTFLVDWMCSNSLSHQPCLASRHVAIFSAYSLPLAIARISASGTRRLAFGLQIMFNLYSFGQSISDTRTAQKQLWEQFERLLR